MFRHFNAETLMGGDFRITTQTLGVDMFGRICNPGLDMFGRICNPGREMGQDFKSAPAKVGTAPTKLERCFGI